MTHRFKVEGVPGSAGRFQLCQTESHGSAAGICQDSRQLSDFGLRLFHPPEQLGSDGNQPLRVPRLLQLPDVPVSRCMCRQSPSRRCIQLPNCLPDETWWP